MTFLSKLFSGKGSQIQDFLERGAVVVDVRTAAEFKSGSIPNSKNIPLDQLGSQKKKLAQLGKPLIFCCATGMRSGQAQQMMKRNGLECMNGGGWRKVAPYCAAKK